MKKIGLLLLIACMGFFVACKENEDPQPNPEDDYAAKVEGTYGSVLDIYVPAPLDAKTIDERDIKITKKDLKSIQVELNDFQFEGIPVGDIKIDDIVLQKNGEEGFSLVAKTVEGMKLANGDITADVKITGVIVGDELDFNLTITKVEGFADAITVNAKGLKGGKYSDDNAKRVEGKYNSELSIVVGGVLAPREKKEITLTATELNKVKFELKGFSFEGLAIGDIAIENIEIKREGQVFSIVEKTEDLSLAGGAINAKTTLKGTVEGNKMLLDLNIDASGLAVTVAVEATNSANSSTLANILDIEFESPVIVKHPELGLNQTELTIEFGSATAEEMNNVTLKALQISDNATSSIAAGSKVDFTKDGGKVQITITAESGATKTYTITAKGVNVVGGIDRFDFEEWKQDNTNTDPQRVFYAPTGGWTSSNHGVDFMKTFYKDKYVPLDKSIITQSTDAHSGKSAAKIETIDTKGAYVIITSIPKVTTGSLYLGEFSVNINNTLESTKFGIPFYKEPKTIKGFYKYIPGDVFYRSSGDPKKAHEVTIEENTVDECVVSGVLYEYDPTVAENDTKYTTYLNGVNLYTSDKVVAVAKFVGKRSDTYKEFSVDFIFQNEKVYDKNKNYRLAIVASSSAEGDTFSGAPGSVLYVDDIEIISE